MALTSKPEMMGVTIFEEQDERLERNVPRTLQGEKNASKRVRWALDEFLAILGSVQNQAPQPKKPA